MSDFKRIRGDNYPFVFTLSVNNKIIDISNDTITFNYKNDTEAIKTITGVLANNGADGKVKFVPDGTLDFLVSGIFNYDVQRVSNGYTYTHAKGILILDDDI